MGFGLVSADFFFAGTSVWPSRNINSYATKQGRNRKVGIANPDQHEDVVHWVFHHLPQNTRILALCLVASPELMVQ